MPSAYVCFIFFFLILVLGFAGAPVFYDPDTAWHLAAGDLIRATHHVPVNDSWSFASANEFWYNLSWLFDITISALFAGGGFSALYAVTVVVFAGSITLMARHSLKAGASPIAVLLLTLPVMLVVFTGTLARPNMCSVVLTVLFFQGLCSLRDPCCRSYIIILPLCMCLWANLHGGFLLAFPLMGIFWLEAFIKGDRKLQQVYGVVFAGCLAASLVNPYGFAVYYGAGKTLFSPFNENLIEWRPVAIGHNIQMTLLFFIVLVCSDFQDRKIAFSYRAVALLVLMLALASFRHAAVASLLMLPYLSLRVTGLLRESRWSNEVEKADEAIIRDMQTTGARLVSLLMVIIATVLVASPQPRDALLEKPVGFDSSHFPRSEAEYILAHYAGKRFFNSYNIGGYLDYLWRGKVKLFIDGRANSLYSNEVLKDYEDFAEDHGFGLRAEMIAKRYGFDGLIIASDDKNAALWNSNPEWQKVFNGKTAAVFVRKNSQDRK